MSASKRAAAFLLLLAAAAPLRAWQDPFNDWTASGYLQVLQINRPTGGLPPYGPLAGGSPAAPDQGAVGYNSDGLWYRSLALSLSGPLGWQGFSADLEMEIYHDTAFMGDLYVRWDGAFGTLRLGQSYLPFGVEQQTDKADLVGIQRSLMYGFGNFGSIQPWGLQLMNQRGFGLRWDADRSFGPLKILTQAGAMNFGGGYLYAKAEGGIGRLALRWAGDVFGVEAGYSALLGRADFVGTPAYFTPLGAAQGAPLQAADDLSGKGGLASWGPDAHVDAGPLHAQGELALQSLDGLLRGGGQATVWLDLDGLLAHAGAAPGWRRAYLYTKWEQAFSDFGDGVHQAGALYSATTYGLRLPTGWRPASLKVEYMQVGSDSFGDLLPDGRIVQVQLQFML